MAVGDVVNGLSSVSAAGFLDLQPAAGVEWIIHNIYYEAEVEFYFYDGTNAIKFDSDSSYGGRLGFVFHCTNSKYLRVKNVNAAAKLIGYDGVQTK